MNDRKLLLAATAAVGIGALFGAAIHPVPLTHAGEDWRERYRASPSAQAQAQPDAGFVDYGGTATWLYGLATREQARFADAAALRLVDPPPPPTYRLPTYRLEDPIGPDASPPEERAAQSAVEQALTSTATITPPPEAAPPAEQPADEPPYPPAPEQAALDQ